MGDYRTVPAISVAGCFKMRRPCGPWSMMPPARCQPFHLPHALRLQTKTVGMLSFLRTAGLAADTGNGQQGTGAQFVNFVAINNLALCTWLGSVLRMPYCSNGGQSTLVGGMLGRYRRQMEWRISADRSIDRSIDRYTHPRPGKSNE